METQHANQRATAESLNQSTTTEPPTAIPHSIRDETPMSHENHEMGGDENPDAMDVDTVDTSISREHLATLPLD